MSFQIRIPSFTRFSIGNRQSKIGNEETSLRPELASMFNETLEPIRKLKKRPLAIANCRAGRLALGSEVSDNELY